MKTLILLFGLMFYKGGIHAQSISMDAISSGGDTYQNATGMLSFTEGEVMSETFSSPLNLIGNGFQQTYLTYWVGMSSASWLDPVNWNGGPVPDAGTDIVILPSVPVNLIITQNVSCRSLTERPGASVTIQSGVILTLTGH